MRGKNDARIHTGRNDCNGRPRGTRRRTAIRYAATPETAARARLFKRSSREEAQADYWRWWQEASAGDEGLDGLHSDETP